MATIKKVRLVLNQQAALDSGISSFSKLVVSTQKTPTTLRPTDRIQMSKARMAKGHIMADLVREKDCLVAEYTDHRVAAAFHLNEKGAIGWYKLIPDNKTRGNYISSVSAEEITNDLGFTVELIEVEIDFEIKPVEPVAVE